LETKIPEPFAQRVDCLRLYVSDLDAGIAFYRDQLGHPLAWRTEHAVGLRMPQTDTEIVLQTEDHWQEIDIKVESADAAAVRFEQAGGRVTVPPFDIQIGRAVVVQDPWGNQFVLLDTSKGLFVTDDNGIVIGNGGHEI
jgi:lactoylglutathione lyase